MSGGRRLRWLWVLLAAGSVACTSSRQVLADIHLGVVDGSSVVGVPFVEQQPDTCGAAALASVLAHLGQTVSEVEMAVSLRTQQRRGAITYELALEARRHDALAVQRYDVLPDVLMRAIDAGVAPIVLRGNPLHEALNRYHYSVLIAYDRTRHVWIAHDGEEANVVFSFDQLDSDHARAGRWVLFVISPQQRPEGLPPDVHLEWGLQAQELGDIPAAAHHYASAAWTTSAPQALLNLSNLAAAEGNHARTVDLLRMAHQISPTSAAVKNNLAWALYEAGGDLDEAERLAEEAALDPEVQPYALDTLAHLREARRARQALPDAPDGQHPPTDMP